MIRLFRKIRHQLLSEDKYPIYILYATGEIILVVIGILLALQIDNWNLNRKTQDDELNLLSEMIVNLENDINILDANIGFHEGGARACQLILEYMSSGQPFHDTLSRYFAMTNNHTVFAPNVGAYESLKSRGIDIIRNNDIRLKLVNLYEQSYHTIQPNIEHFTGQIMELKMTLYPSRFEEFQIFDVRNIDPGAGYYGGLMVPTHYEDLRTDPIYIYHLRSLKKGHEYLIVFNKMTKQATENMIELLKEEIRKRN